MRSRARSLRSATSRAAHARPSRASPPALVAVVPPVVDERARGRVRRWGRRRSGRGRGRRAAQSSTSPSRRSRERVAVPWLASGGGPRAARARRARRPARGTRRRPRSRGAGGRRRRARAWRRLVRRASASSARSRVPTMPGLVDDQHAVGAQAVAVVDVELEPGDRRRRDPGLVAQLDRGAGRQRAADDADPAALPTPRARRRARTSCPCPAAARTTSTPSPGGHERDRRARPARLSEAGARAPTARSTASREPGATCGPGGARPSTAGRARCRSSSGSRSVGSPSRRWRSQLDDVVALRATRRRAPRARRRVAPSACASANACSTSRRSNVLALAGQPVSPASRSAIRATSSCASSGPLGAVQQLVELAPVEAVLGGPRPPLARAADPPARRSPCACASPAPRSAPPRVDRSPAPASCATISARRCEKCSISSRGTPTTSAEPFATVVHSQPEPLAELVRAAPPGRGSRRSWRGGTDGRASSAVQRPSGAARAVGDDDVGVQLRIAGPRGAVPERRRDEPRPGDRDPRRRGRAASDTPRAPGSPARRATAASCASRTRRRDRRGSPTPNRMLTLLGALNVRSKPSVDRACGAGRTAHPSTGCTPIEQRAQARPRTPRRRSPRGPIPSRSTRRAPRPCRRSSPRGPGPQTGCSSAPAPSCSELADRQHRPQVAGIAKHPPAGAGV